MIAWLRFNKRPEKYLVCFWKKEFGIVLSPNIKVNVGEPQNNQQRNNSDQMDSYNQRFESYAIASQWRVEDWATSLGALLTGKALKSYSRLSEEDAVNYNELKNTLLKRYNLTKEGYRKKIRQIKP